MTHSDGPSTMTGKPPGSPPGELLAEEAARAQILAQIVPLPRHRVSLLGALGRFSGSEAFAREALPGFDNSSMDGYAVAWPPQYAQASPLPPGTMFRVEGEQPAGRSRELSVVPGQAVRIFTGAPIPSGTDAVVMQEDVDRAGNEIRLKESVHAGEFIRRAGGDVARGQRLFGSGERLTAQRVGLLASQGIATVEISRAPRVAILATGDELREPGDCLSPGEIYESNGITLAALASMTGAEVTIVPRASDERADLDAKIAAGLRAHDVLIVAGGVSVGERDLVKERLAAASVNLELWRVAVQPGKPFLYGKAPGSKCDCDCTGNIGKEGTHVFGLPGNPVSAFVTFLLFVRPALLKLMGAGPAELALPTAMAEAGEELTNRGARPHYLRGNVDADGRFFLSGKQESHALFGLSRSQALTRVPPGTSVPAGARISVYVWAL